MVRAQPPVICAFWRAAVPPPSALPTPSLPILVQAGALPLLRPASLCPTSKSHTGRRKQALASAVIVSNGNTPGPRRSAASDRGQGPGRPPDAALGPGPCEGALAGRDLPGKPGHLRVSLPGICSLFFTRTRKIALTFVPCECHKSARRRKETLFQERLLKSQS